MKILHIREPFWGAWKVYNWEKPIPGIGISIDNITKAIKEIDDVRLKIRKDETIYRISPADILYLGRRYNSRRKVRDEVEVIVVPMNKLKKEKI